MHFRKDFFAGLVVFLVALPLCLGIALASGAPLISGIISGIIGGVCVSLISTSHVSVSGPAAGLTVLVADAIISLGSFEKFLCAVILSGIFQIAFSILRLGFTVDYVPTSVIQGMMSAIGAVIIIKQIPHALGRDLDYEGNFSFFGSSLYGNSANELFEAIVSLHPGAASISLISLLILLSWKKLSTFFGFLKLIPPSLIVVFLSVWINWLFKEYAPGFYIAQGQGHRVEVPSTLQNISSFISSIPKPEYNTLFSLSVFKVGIVIAIVASIETLLSLEASEKLDKKKRLTDSNRELLAQGVGNILSGICGGLPLTSVVVRTTANVNAGCETKYASFIHGILLLISIVFFSHYLNEIPLSALAAVLIIVGAKLCSYRIFMKQYALGHVQNIPFLITIFAIICSDLLTGVILGWIVGLFFVLKSTHRFAFTIASEGDHYLIRFNKDVSFLNKAELKEKLNEIPNNCNLILDGTKATRIDHDIKDLLADFIKSAHYKNIKIELKHIRDIPETT